MPASVEQMKFRGQLYDLFDDQKPTDEQWDQLHTLYKQAFILEGEGGSSDAPMKRFYYFLRLLKIDVCILNDNSKTAVGELLDTPINHITPFIKKDDQSCLASLAYMITHIPEGGRPIDGWASVDKTLDERWLSRFLAIPAYLLSRVSPVLLNKFHVYSGRGNTIDDPEVYIDTLRENPKSANQAFVRRVAIAASYMAERNLKVLVGGKSINDGTVAIVEKKARHYLIGAVATSVIGVGLGLAGCLMPVLNEMVSMTSSAGIASLAVGAVLLALTVVVAAVLLSKYEQHTPKGMQRFWDQRGQLAQDRVAKLPVPSSSCSVDE